MNALVPCPACRRHVRSSEAACPFCASSLPSDLRARAVPAANKRLDRLAAFTFAASVAVTGCTISGGEETTTQEGELGSVMPMYGMPAPERDAGPAEDAGPTDTEDGGAAPCDDGSPYAMYGLPAFEPCPVDPPVEDGGATAEDAGSPKDDGGGIMPMYGMPADDGT